MIKGEGPTFVKTNHNRGFTVVELIVTVTIFVFMTALIIVRYGAYNQGTMMTNLAYDVALAVRTAQTYGVSVKVSSPTGQDFSAAYGVEFQTGQNSFILFVDANTNGFYDAGPDLSELVLQTQFF